MNPVAIILGGGAGSRLQPLTRDRSKPAVPIGGKYRLVDVPISNCINSNIRKMYLLTQYNSVSLHEHVQSTYIFDPFHYGFVRLLAAQQTPSSGAWFEGTADAVRQSLPYVEVEYPDVVVVLSGDQLYRMNFQEVIDYHFERGADVTISTTPVPRDQAGSLGIMKVDQTNRINQFVEKPGDTPELTELKAPMFEDERYLASMGIYVFNTDVLRELLANDKVDFGKDIIPEAISDRKVYSYVFEGYWRDIGTVKAFWEANLELTDPAPRFSFYQPEAPVFTHMRFLPPSKIQDATLDRCLLSDGCLVSSAHLKDSIVGVRGQVGEGTRIENSVLMGADYMEVDPENIPTGIGKNCTIKNAIIDKNARIGDNTVITPEGKADGTSTQQYTVRDGIIVIPKNTVIPPGTHL